MTTKNGRSIPIQTKYITSFAWTASSFSQKLFSIFLSLIDDNPIVNQIILFSTQETVKQRAKLDHNRPKTDQNTSWTSHVPWLTIETKLLSNCSYYDKLSGYVYDNFR
jgi:hypothetical protein